MSERKGHRKLRLCSKKNYERKRRAVSKHQAVLSGSTENTAHIDFSDRQTQPKVNTKMQHQEEVVSLTVSVPVLYFTEQAVSSLDMLHRRLQRFDAILEDWIYVFENGEISVCQLGNSDKGLQVTLSVTIKEDFSWILTYRGESVEPKFCTFIQDLSLSTNSVSRFCNLLNHLSASKVCKGNSEPQFLSLPNIHKNSLMDHSTIVSKNI